MKNFLMLLYIILSLAILSCQKDEEPKITSQEIMRANIDGKTFAAINFVLATTAQTTSINGTAGNVSKPESISIVINNLQIGTFELSETTHYAAYGEQLLQKLALRLDADGFSYRNLKLYRQFYQLYSPVGKLAFPLIKDIPQIGQTMSAQLDSWQAIEKVGLPIEQVMAKISFSHLVELMAIEDTIKRAFYEIETIKGNWAVRELRRQINTLYFERMGLSKDLPKLSEYVQSKAVHLTPRDIIQSPFTFEFLGLKAPDVLSEHDLEKALLDNLQDFMLELGNGFCLEARQKRLLIGDEHYFVDMVFYHRLLRCHILIELKIDEFKHEYIGQLNSYLGYYKAEVMPPEDNPPIGILLVTNQNKTLVEYATAGLDDRLFVQKYLTELPSKEKLEQFIQSHL